MKGHLSHVSYFLSGATRKAYQEGKIELVPNVFHEVPRMLKKVNKHVNDHDSCISNG